MHRISAAEPQGDGEGVLHTFMDSHNVSHAVQME